MSYLSEEAILWAIRSLKATTHPFVGITFLACKESGLPVGRTARMSLDSRTREHLLRHHRLDPESEHFFQPFKSHSYWVKKNYASTGLQAVNTQTFAEVFLHERGRAEWGFREDYIQRTRLRLRELGHALPPLAAIAIWTGKDREWTQATTLGGVVGTFLKRFNITKLEGQKLFSPRPTPPPPGNLLQNEPPDLRAIAYGMALPPDADEPEGTLTAIEMKGVGPADALRLDLGKRLTVVAGDNGLGKSFLLDVTWWAATGRWAGAPATPFTPQDALEAMIEYDLRTDVGEKRCSSYFYPSTQTWLPQSSHPHVAGLYLYARVDGSFSVVDDERERSDESGTVNLTSQEVWDGNWRHRARSRRGRRDTEGLLRDCVRWQSSNEDAFSLLEKVLERLSPSDLGTLKLGTPRRQYGDPRPIPMIRHPYGEIPVVHASAGVRRALALAYMIVWSWLEHQWASELMGFEPVRRVLLVVDEIEAHLHPLWQRTMLPAILGLGELLGDDLEMQTVVSTHSPLVLASLETEFRKSDALYHLDLHDTQVDLERLEFHKYGDVSSWLTSPVMGLRSARSQEAERAIHRAMAIQSAKDPEKFDVEAATRELLDVLPPDDQFWRRWTFFARQAGIKL